MAVSFAKTYAGSDTSGFIADFTAAWSWAAIDHEDDSAEWIFYIDDEKNKGFKISENRGQLQIQAVFYGSTYFTQSANTFLTTRFTATSTCFVLDWYGSASTGIIKPYSNYKYMICTGADQETGTEEQLLVYCDSSSSTPKSALFASDMVNVNISANAVDCISSNKGAELTVIQPMFHKNSKFIAKDAFTMTATQLSEVAYGGITLGGKSYYMCGWVLVEDN